MKLIAVLVFPLLLVIGCKTHSQNQSVVTKKTARDTIPFTIGSDNGIHIMGTINGSEPLDFLFDTGANAVVIASSLLDKKIAMQLDGQTENNGADGISTMQTSSNNHIKISGLEFINTTIVSIPYNQPIFDAVLGWIVFDNKIVEINYDIKKLIIHDSLIIIPNGFVKLETKHEGNLYYVKALVDVDGTQSEGWLEYDTGCNSNLLLSQDYASKHNLNNKMKSIGLSTSVGSAGISWKSDRSILPSLKIGGFELNNIPIDINQSDPPGNHPYDLLGNNIMKRYNTIIDFKNNVVYIKPNSLFKNSF